MTLPVNSSCQADEAARAYVQIFADTPCRALVANVATRLEIATLDNGRWLVPVSVNDGTPDDQCYVCSPRSHYVDYTAFELSRLGPRWLGSLLRGAFTGVAGVLQRADLDRVVIVNNWLLSTNLYPRDWHGEGLGDTVHALAVRHPGHAVLLRSLNERQNPAPMAAVRRAGARLLASRVVWHYDGATADFTGTANYRRDQLLLANPAWEIVGPDDVGPGDMDGFERLYAQLYLEKYTPLNPRYTARYLGACHALGLLRFQGIRARATDRWLGVIGTFEQHGVLTAPIVGYDARLPQTSGLYRALMALVLRDTARRKLLLNLSAGAGSFKRSRGGRPCVEHTAVFDAHLPPARRRPWKALEAISNRIGLPVTWRKEVGR